ncbi:GntR family transcriptional regulator [Caballeronia sordidicola]|uniref:GntR family transcriptional regulator n=1 Tax=Caballeronia sordidicola TaxID=196367 RepID=UPI0015C4F84F|nr:GntR family transcriptional regulator [Caballeronia sordidicola]
MRKLTDKTLPQAIFFVRENPMTEPSPPSLVQHAIRRLRQDILEGRMPPLHKLKIEVLRDAYGISSTPVREALTRLAQEGLVTNDLRRGFRVAPMSLDDFADIIRLRLIIESDALAVSIHQCTEAWQTKVRSSYEQLMITASMMNDGPSSTPKEWAEVHKSFHSAIISGCGSARQLEICDALYDQAERYVRLSARTRAIPRARGREHEMLYEAVLGKNLDVALPLFRQHLELTLRSIGDQLGNTEPLESPTLLEGSAL